MAWEVVAAALQFAPVLAQSRLGLVQALRDCARCAKLVVLPSGTFTMGSAETEPGALPSEGPQRHVGIKAFAFGVLRRVAGLPAEVQAPDSPALRRNRSTATVKNSAPSPATAR